MYRVTPDNQTSTAFARVDVYIFDRLVRRETMTHDEIIDVIAAHRDGKPLQQKGTVAWLNYKPAGLEDLLFHLSCPVGPVTIRPKPEPRRVYVPCDANGCCGKAYSLLDYAEREYPNAEIVTFVEEASE